MKKIQINIEDVFNLPTAVIYLPDKFIAVNNITIDSRIVKKKSLFVAIRGKRFDGHDFVKDAIRNGATSIVINESKLADYDEVKVPIITVKDTAVALGDLAKVWRKKLMAKVVAVTGSSGKTTVKDMIADLLSEKFRVSKTKNNDNNHIGVPLTIFNTNEKHQVLVAELGTNHFGEIPYTSGIISPDYALITNIGASHLQYLKNKKGVWKEKSTIFDETISNNGKLFINYDDPLIRSYMVKGESSVKYSLNSRTDVFGKIKKYTDDGRPVIELVKNGKRILTELPLYGEQSANSFVAAAAVALEFGISKTSLLKGLSKVKMPKGRMNVIKLKDFVLIDDTYNSNPESAKAAIELVGRIKTHKRKVLFLGDMLELGKYEIPLHEELARSVNKAPVNEVYTIGPRMKYLSGKLNKKNIIVKHFRNRKSLTVHIHNIDLKNSVVLVKGSRKMHMEDFLNEIKRKAV